MQSVSWVSLLLLPGIEQEVTSFVVGTKPSCETHDLELRHTWVSQITVKLSCNAAKCCNQFFSETFELKLLHSNRKIFQLYYEREGFKVHVKLANGNTSFYALGTVLWLL